MPWQGPPDTARPWPGAHLPPGAHPRGTTYNHFGVPHYPPGTTCQMLGEPAPYFPWKTAPFLFLSLLLFVLYICWPAYVAKQLVRNKSVYGDQKAFEANYDKYRKESQGLGVGGSSEGGEERSG